MSRTEEKFARAFRSSPVGLAVTRLRDGQFIEVNEAACSFLGYSMDELIGKTTVSLGLWPSLEDRQILVNDLTQYGSVRNRDLTFLTKQGKEVVCEYAAELIEIDGEPCVLSVLLDITARRDIEQALKANEELLRLFVKHTPAAIAMFDTDMRYLQVSDRFLTDYHLEGQDIIGKFHYDIFPNLPERWKEAHRRILAGAVERQDEELYEEPDGSQGWLAWESLPWRKADGEIGGLILFTQVITERKRAEQALRSSEERFARIFNLSPYRMGIVRLSDGVILDVNDCWVKEIGFTREETINRVIYELDQWITDEARLVVENMLKEKKPIRSIEGTIKTKSGEHRYALGSVAIVDFDGEPCYLWAANDITDRKLAEEQLRALSAKIRSAREEEGTRIAREIHDELGGALTGLKWDLERIDSSLSHPDGGSTIADVRKRISSMTGLIESTINKVRSISSELRPGVLDDLGLVAAIEWEAQQFQKRTGLNVHWETELETAEVSVDGATAVFRIFQEVLTNVLRHSRAQNIHIKLHQDEHQLELQVVDDGRGITEEEKTNTRSLGLLGMKERALLVGGEVNITGAESKGTTVVVRIPLNKAAASEAIA